MTPSVSAPASYIIFFDQAGQRRLPNESMESSTLLPAALAALLLAPAWAGTAPSRAFPEVLIDDRGHPAERRALDAALTRLKRSPTARRLARRHRRLAPVVLSFAPISGSSSSGLEDTTLGRSLCAQDPPGILIDDRLAVSTRPITDILAHELYGHDLIVRAAPRSAGGVAGLMENEAWALAVGYVVALEAGDPTFADDAADWIAESTGAYYSQHLFSDSPERIELSLSEAREPRAAIAARLRELARRRRWVEIRKKDMEVWNFRLAHMEKAHGLDARSVRELQDSLDVFTSTLIPNRAALLNAAEPHLKSVQQWLDEPEGRAWEAEMIAVSTDPYAMTLEADWAALGRRLAELRARQPKPPEPPPSAPAELKQLTWDEATALVDEDQAAHPGHWQGAPETEEPVDWIVK